MILGIVGATGAVGEEALRLVQERRVAAREVRVFATDDSIGIELDYFEDSLSVEAAELDRLTDCDVVLHAAPADRPRLDALTDRGVRVVDVSGAWELDPQVPLVAGALGAREVEQATRVAVARGASAALALALAPLSEESALRRVTVTVLEGAGGAGRRGLDALSEQTVQLLNAMDGGAEEGSVFPATLAFDCLPLVGETTGGETDEEERMRAVVRRLLGAPTLAFECARVRVPVFLGSLCSVHVETGLALQPARDRLLKAPALELLDADTLPTPRTALGLDRVAVGRLRETDGGLAFVLAQDDLRRGSALTAIECVETWAS